MGQYPKLSRSVRPLLMPSGYPDKDGYSDNRLEFPGKCSDKTGASAKGFSSDYKEFLAKSFETQTYVYEQAVRLFHLPRKPHLYSMNTGELINSPGG